MSDPVFLALIIFASVFAGTLAALRVEAWLERRSRVHLGL